MSNPDGGVESLEVEGSTAPREGEPDRIEGAPAEEAAAEGRTDAEAKGITGDAGAEDGTGDAEADDGQAEEEALPPLVAVLEAALFASAEAVPLTRLTRVLGAWTRKQVSEALKELAARQEREGSGLRVVEAAGGFQLRSVRDYAPWVRKFFAERPPRLSRAVLETVAIIAYRQPATRGEIEAVRGVNCDAILGTLTARGLVQVVGRRQSPGRPVEYGTTRQFLELFSLRDLSQLPPLPDPSSLAELVDSAEVEEEDTLESGVVEDGAQSGPAGSEGDVDANPSGVEGAELEDGSEPASEPRRADEDDGSEQRTASEDFEPGRDRLPEVGGGADPGGPGPGEREGDPGAGSQG